MISTAGGFVRVGVLMVRGQVKLHTRTELTIQDCDTKHGTIWNSEEIKGTVTLDTRNEHSFYLGKHGCAFRFAIYTAPASIGRSWLTKAG